MKKIIALALSVMMLLSICAFASAEEYTPGVTVAANPESKTGYTVTIVYEAPGAEKVDLAGSFAFYYDDPEIRSKTPETYYTPAEYQEGMFAIGQESHREPMTKVEGTDLFVTTYDLPSGHYQYCFYVGDDTVRKDDPTNPGQYANIEGGGKYTRSVFDVPYADVQGTAKDYAFAAKVSEDKAGTITYVNYDAIDGTKGSIGVYTPNGYDANRAEPYPVLYLANGTGGDETFWYGGGAAGNIFDNLIANGQMAPALIVCMNAERYTFSDPFEWDYDTQIEDVVKNIIPFMEANYNVDKTPEGRAFAGLSRGAFLTSRVMAKYPETFKYYGMLSGGNSTLDISDKLDVIKTRNIMMGAGTYDFLYGGNASSVAAYEEYLKNQGVECTNYTVNGAHEWFTWIQLLYELGLNHLWK